MTLRPEKGKSEARKNLESRPPDSRGIEFKRRRKVEGENMRLMELDNKRKVITAAEKEWKDRGHTTKVVRSSSLSAARGGSVRPAGWALYVGGKKKEVYPKKGQKIYTDRWDATVECETLSTVKGIPHYMSKYDNKGIFYLYKVSAGEFVRVYGTYKGD